MQTDLDYALHRLDRIGSQLRLPSERDKYPDFIAELRDIIQLLEYHALPKEGIGELSEGFFGPTISCHQCNKSWSVPDACLLLFKGTWLCRDHHPPLNDGGIRPPGYQPPAAERDALEANRVAVRAELSREELRFINTRIGG